MIAQPTVVKLGLVSTDAATMSFSGPFGCVPEALKTAECTLRGWSRGMLCCDGDEELDVTIEFDYGDYIYHEKHTLFNPVSGGVQATLFWVDADVSDWMEKELPGQITAKRMIEQCL